MTGLKRNGLTIPPEINDVVILSSFAWEAGYPGLSEPVTADEHQESLAHAEAVVAWAVKEIGE